MRRVARASLAALLSAALAGACATAPPRPSPGPDPAPPVGADRETPAPAPDARCASLAALAEAGEHKPALDEMALLGPAGAACPQSVLDAVELSRSRLAEADAKVLEARRREEGSDLAGARESLGQALQIYPRYHWAAKLARDLDARIAEEIVLLRRQAAERRAAGDSPGALEALGRAAALDPSSPASGDLDELRRRLARESLTLARGADQTGDLGAAGRHLEQAMAAAPDAPELRLEILEYARLLGLKLYSAGELTRARDLWRRALELDETNEKIQGYLRDVEERLRSLDRIKQG